MPLLVTFKKTNIQQKQQQQKTKQKTKQYCGLVGGVHEAELKYTI
jgi:hypothetical protein